MNSDLESTTEVTVTLTGRRATIEDVQSALDVLLAEGIPETFEIDVDQRETTDYLPNTPPAERPIRHSLTVSASRAAKVPR